MRVEINTLFQLRYLEKPVQLVNPVCKGTEWKVKKVLQYRTRPEETCTWSPWMDVVTDIEGEEPKGSY